MNRRAFTLIELLVVIAIIAILAAILFPVFAQAKQAAKKASDLSNQKQITLSVIMYEGDFDDTMPITVPADNGTTIFTTPWDRTPSANPTLRQVMYANSLAPYIKNWSIWASPSHAVDWLAVPGDPGPGNPNPNNFALSYTMNSYLNTMSASSLEAPVSVITFWPGMGTTQLPGFTFAMPLIITASHGFLAQGQFPGDAYKFQNTGPDCVSGFGWFGGPAGTTANYNVFNNGMNLAEADGHAKFAMNGSFNSPVASTNAQGNLTGYWVNTVDNAAGCGYAYALSPFRTQ